MYQEQVYRNYVSEALRNMSENIAKGFSFEGATYIGKSYADILYPEKVPDKSADEIIDGIKQKLREYE